MNRIVIPSKRIKRTLIGRDTGALDGTSISSIEVVNNGEADLPMPKGSNSISFKNTGPGKCEISFDADQAAWPLENGAELLKIRVAEGRLIKVKSVSGPAMIILFFEG